MSTMSRRESRSKDLLRQLLREYYIGAELWLPNDYPMREFAFQTYENEVYVRHMAFQSVGSLRDYLMDETPRQAYFSAALYRDPAAENMEDKGWLGSELMFDIDSDHLPGCGEGSVVVNGRKIPVVRRECMQKAKEEVVKLVDVITEDLGFSRSDIVIYFSGNRGFHVVVLTKNNEWRTLPSHLRKEIVDYITGRGLDPEIIVPRVPKKAILLPPTKNMGGWRGRLARLNLTYENLLNNLQHVIDVAGVHIDEMVTQDISRLIRIPGTINGKSGLPAIKLSLPNEFNKFNYGPHLSPFKCSAIVLSQVKKKIKFEFMDVKYSLFPSLRMKVPCYVAVFMALNRLVRIDSLIH